MYSKAFIETKSAIPVYAKSSFRMLQVRRIKYMIASSAKNKILSQEVVLK